MSRTQTPQRRSEPAPAEELGHLPRSPRLAQVVRVLVQRIRAGHYPPGQQLPTIRELAQEHGLSFGSARSAVDFLKRAGLVESLQGSGTFVSRQAFAAQGSAKGARTAWALFFADPRLHVSGPLPVLLSRLLSDAGITACLGAWHAHMTEQQLLEQCQLGPQKHPPRAIVVMNSDTRRDQFIDRYAREYGVRVINVLRLPRVVYPNWHTVVPDYYGAYQAAARDLIGKGHRRIGVVTKQRVISSFWVHTVRKSRMLETQGPLAVGRTLREAGIRDGLSIHYNLHVRKDPSGYPMDEPNVLRMMRWLQSPRRPSAVIADDYRVPGLMLAAARAGLRVPQDLAVIAVCGALPTQMFSGPSISLRYDLMAQRIADLILMDQEILGQHPRSVVVTSAWTPVESEVKVW